MLIAPWRPWATDESLDAQGGGEDDDLGDVSVLVPARDEAAQIGTTLAGLRRQGRGLRIILIDDQSTDGTAAVARACRIEGLQIVYGTPLPPGWSGKLWALHQGLAYVRTERVLLLDADVELLPGILPALRAKLRQDGRHLVSLLVSLRMDNLWERFLMPAFVYFFKLLYPFRLSNSPAIPFVACAAGGCILLEARVLREIGGFAAIRDALIDDCALAGRVKKHGFRTWIGLTHSARSLRPYPSLQSIWDMVARTAFTQLRYSPALLVLCTVVMLCAFAAPVAALALGRVAGGGGRRPDLSHGHGELPGRSQVLWAPPRLDAGPAGCGVLVPRDDVELRDPLLAGSAIAVEGQAVRYRRGSGRRVGGHPWLKTPGSLAISSAARGDCGVA